eukprot:jgi/Botrbrau1/6223/Bobra.0109s0018.1
MASAMQTNLRLSVCTGRPVLSRPNVVKAKIAVLARQDRQRAVIRADYLGSPTNLIMVISTTLFLAAGRFGLAPTATKTTTAGLKLTPQNPGLKSGDPSGFSAVDVLGLGALGHVVGVGTVLGLRAIGAI